MQRKRRCCLSPQGEFSDDSGMSLAQQKRDF